MKLAEALIYRADLQRKIAQIETRMLQNAKVQEGDEPAESVDKLMAEFEGIVGELTQLITRINKTNSETPFEEGTLSEAITRRDGLKSKIRVYQNLHGEACISQERYSNSELRFVRCVNVADLQKEIDALSKQYRILDTKIQEKNWTVDLLT